MAPAAELDVGGLVRAVGHVVVGQVRDAQQQVAERRVGGCRLGLEPRDLVLLLGDQRTQALELGLVAAALAAPTSRLAALRSASAASAAAMRARRVSSSARTSSATRRHAAAGERGIERVRLLADLADVVRRQAPTARGRLSPTAAGSGSLPGKRGEAEPEGLAHDARQSSVEAGRG